MDIRSCINKPSMMDMVHVAKKTNKKKKEGTHVLNFFVFGEKNMK